MSEVKFIELIKDNVRFSGELLIDDEIISIKSDLVSISRKGKFYFFILKEIRSICQLDNIYILVNGSRIDVYPSGMSLISQKAYVQTIGKQTFLDDLVNIFDTCSDLKIIGSVEEQSNYHHMWIESLK